MITSGDVEPRVVNDYDILFLNGISWPITIDEVAGDKIDFLPDRIQVHLAGRPSVSDPSKALPAEDQTVYLTNVIIVAKRKRLTTPQSPEQKVEYTEILKKATKTVH